MTEGPRYTFPNDEMHGYTFLRRVGPLDLWHQDKDHDYFRYSIGIAEDACFGFDYGRDLEDGELPDEIAEIRVICALLGEGPV